MFSESDDDELYTVHEVRQQSSAPHQASSPQDTNEQREVQADKEAPVASPLARYYPLGTQQRHAFDTHMRRLREETLKSEQERRFRQEHPFQPLRDTAAPSSAVAEATTKAASESQQANAAPHEGPTAPSRGVEVVNTAATPVQPVFDRLAAQAVQLEIRRRHREEQQRRAEAAALRDAFHPEINRSTALRGEPPQRHDAVPVEDRLLHYGEVVARERQRRAELKALEEQAALQAAQSSVIGGGALQDLPPEERRRAQAEFEARSARFLAAKAQHRSRAAEAAAAAFTFQPQISATSAALDEARRRERAEASRSELQDLLSRSTDGAAFDVSQQSAPAAGDGSRRSDALYAQAVERQRQRSRLQSLSPRRAQTQQGAQGQTAVSRTASTVRHAQLTVDEPEAPSYQPRTNPTSDRWIASGPHRHFFEKSFVHRQQLYEQVKAEEASLKKADSKCGEAAGGRGEGEDKDGASSPAAKVSTRQLNERLYYSARKASEVAQQRRVASLNAQECPFRPELSPGTQYVLQRLKATRDTDVVRRLTGAQLHKGKGELREEQLELYAPAPAEGRRPNATSPDASAAAPVSPRLSQKTESSHTDPAADAATAAADQQPSAPPRKRAVLTRDQVEKFYQRQLDFLQSRQDLIRERRDGEAVQELVECTFRPRTNTERREASNSSGGSAVPRRSASANASAGTADSSSQPLAAVTGVAGFLERQATARRRKAEHDELVERMGLPRHTPSSSARHGSSGTTLLSPFDFQTEQRRRRTSCAAPADVTYTSPRDSRPACDASPVWVNALTSSERTLFDALVGGDECLPAATAPLFPLPGYTRRGETAEDDAVYFDKDADAYMGMSPSAYYAERNAMPRPSALPVRATPFGGGDGGNDGDGATATRERVSLFSSLSPNTYRGRSLGSVGERLARDVADGGVKEHGGSRQPSALKHGHTGALSASAQRRKQTRSVSFVVERTSPRSGPSKTAAVPASGAHRAQRRGH